MTLGAQAKVRMLRIELAKVWLAKKQQRPSGQFSQLSVKGKKSDGKEQVQLEVKEEMKLEKLDVSQLVVQTCAFVLEATLISGFYTLV